MARNKSRATRMEEQATIWEGVQNAAKTIAGRLKPMVYPDIGTLGLEEKNLRKVKKLLKEARTAIDLEPGDAESLKEEIESWRDNMEGTNLESTDKFSELGDCFDELETVVDDIEGLSFEYEPKEVRTMQDAVEAANDLKEVIDSIENVVTEAQSISFPGMY